MIEYYSKRAKEYDLVYQKEERQNDLLFLSDYLKNSFRGLDVLDVGCGTGYWSEKIATTARSIYGIDINTSVLDIAQARNYYSTPFYFRELSYHDLDKIPRQFLGISCNFVWSHIFKNDLKVFVDELLNKLEKGGKLIIIDNKYVEGSNTPISRKDKNGNTFQNRKLKNGEVFEVLKNFPTKKEMEVLLQDKIADYKWIELEYFWILEIIK